MAVSLLRASGLPLLHGSPRGARLRLRPMGQCLEGHHPKPHRLPTPTVRACTEISRPYVRSLTRAPLGIIPLLRPPACSAGDYNSTAQGTRSALSWKGFLFNYR